MSGTELSTRDLQKQLTQIADVYRRSHALILRQAVIKAQNRHGGLRAAARALKIDVAYLMRLRDGQKTNPSDEVLKKLGLKP